MPQAIVQLLPMIVLFAVFYFILIRPQQQRQKKHQDLVSNLKKGDKITTIGGLYGVVTGFKGDKTVILKIAPSVEVEFLRDAISGVRVETKEKAKTKEENKKETLPEAAEEAESEAKPAESKE